MKRNVFHTANSSHHWLFFFATDSHIHHDDNIYDTVRFLHLPYCRLPPTSIVFPYQRPLKGAKVGIPHSIQLIDKTLCVSSSPFEEWWMLLPNNINSSPSMLWKSPVRDSSGIRSSVMDNKIFNYKSVLRGSNLFPFHDSLQSQYYHHHHDCSVVLEQQQHQLSTFSVRKLSYCV